MLLAIGLLLAAVLVAAALLQQSSATKVYLVANRDLGVGTAITAQDVRQAELNLGSQARWYLSSITRGAVLTSPVLAGELIPAKATLPIASPATRPVRVTPSSPLSARIRVGSLVQLWFAPKAVGVAAVSNAIQLLANTQVLAIHKGEASMGRQIDDVELAVPTENLTAVITAIASAGYLSVISEI
jgi:hypothetical protein